MKLSTIANAAKAALEVPTNHAILIYGPPKSGKTRLVGTAAKIPEVENIYFFSLENGHEVLIYECGLTEEEMDKITLFKIQDTRDEPIAIETMLKAMSSKKDINICDMHGRVDCALCLKANKSFTPFNLTKCTHNDLVVIDSGTQLGESALAATLLGKSDMYKAGWDEYGQQGTWLSDILSVVQQAVFTNFVVTAHTLMLEDEDGKDKFFPLIGTKNYSTRAAGKFGTVIYVDKRMNKHVAGSSSTYRGEVLTGSRLGAKIEASKSIDMRAILIDTGILKPKTFDNAPSEKLVMQIDASVKKNDEAKPLSFAETLLANKKKLAEEKAAKQQPTT